MPELAGARPDPLAGERRCFRRRGGDGGRCRLELGRAWVSSARARDECRGKPSLERHAHASRVKRSACTAQGRHPARRPRRSGAPSPRAAHGEGSLGAVPDARTWMGKGRGGAGVHLLLAGCLAVAAACRTQSPPGLQARPTEARTASSPLRLTIVGTNDWHGWMMAHEHRSPEGTVVEEGGIALYAGALSVVRAEAEGPLLLLDAGDIFQGTLASDMGEGAAMVDAFNALEMTAVAVGNHEFDYGPVGPAVIPTAPGDDPLGALKARVAQARFPFLAANVVDATTGRVPDWLGSGTTLREVGGVRVGLIGLTTLDSPRTNPVNVAGLRFLPLAPTARAAAERLRTEGADVIVMVAHAGGRCEEAKDPNDLSRCNRSGEVFEMLEALPPGTVDAVVAGHTHSTMGHFVHTTPVIETSAFGRSFGLITLALDRSTRRPIPAQTRIEAEIVLCERVVEGTSRCDAEALRSGNPLVPATLHDRPLRRDPALEALIAPALARGRHRADPPPRRRAAGCPPSQRER